MEDDLFPYYERELTNFRLAAREFARTHESVARQLLLEPDRCDDPHVERLIEAFAFIAGRIQRKIDDEFPEITEALLGILYPHYLRPVPSLAIARFSAADGQQEAAAGRLIRAGSAVSSLRALGLDAACTFRTCYPVTIWPVQVRAAQFGSASSVSGSHSITAPLAIRIDLAWQKVNAAGRPRIPSLRFFLMGELGPVNTLYELLFTKVGSVSVLSQTGRQKTVVQRLAGETITPVGFGRDEGVLPYPERSFLGYRLLQEYFAFPQKYLFFDVNGLETLDFAAMSETFSILIGLDAPERKDRLLTLEKHVTAETFQLGCTPIVNLFTRKAEPIRVTHSKIEYQVIADIHRQSHTEIYSIDRVSSSAPYLERGREYAPFYSPRREKPQKDGMAYWYATRRPSQRPNDSGTEVHISLVNSRFELASLPEETLNVEVTCTNRDFASELHSVGAAGELIADAGALVKARLLMRPTKALRPPSGRALQWGLISHLSLNRLSVAEGGREALQAILKLYDFSEDPAVRSQIAGVSGVSSFPAVSPMVSENGVVFARGLVVNLELDEDEALLGSRAYLFAAVMEHFFALYTAINSFTQTVMRTRQRKEVVHKWRARCGEQIVL